MDFENAFNLLLSLLKEIHKELQLDGVEDGDLIHIDEELFLVRERHFKKRVANATLFSFWGSAGTEEVGNVRW